MCGYLYIFLLGFHMNFTKIIHLCIIMLYHRYTYAGDTWQILYIIIVETYNQYIGDSKGSMVNGTKLNLLSCLSLQKHVALKTWLHDIPLPNR